MSKEECIFIWRPIFDDQAGTNNSDGSDSESNNSGDDSSSIGGTSTQDNFTQEQVNHILAEEKRKFQKQQQKALDELDALKAKSNLKAKDKEELEERLDHLRNQLLTKEELAKKNQEKLQKDYEEKVKGLETDLSDWKNRYTESTIINGIVDAAAKNNAFDPEQIVAILRPNTQLIEELDSDDGEPTGKFIPVVKFPDKDKEGKPVTLDLSVEEAVKRMKEIDKFFNLFKGEGAGGLGSTTRTKKGEIDIKELAKDPVAYRKARKEGTLQI